MNSSPKAKPDQARQLYNYYPVPEGCPACKDGVAMYNQFSHAQLSGIENLQIGNCPQCDASLDFVIGKMVKGEFVPADLSLATPDGNIMKAFISKNKHITIQQSKN